MYYSREYDIRYLTDLLKISEKLAITPPLNHNKDETTKRFKYYSWTVLVILVLGCSCSLYGKVTLLFPQVKGTSAVLSFLCNLAVCLLNVISIATALSNIENWNIFLNLFYYIDKQLNKSENEMEQKNFLHLQLLMYHFLIVVIFGYDGYVLYNNYGWVLFKYCLFRYVHYYHSFVSILVVMHFASALRQRFRRINNLLTKSNNLHNIINSLIPNSVPQRIDNIRTIEEVANYYLLLAELVGLFNKLFGWQIFFMTENIVFLLLECLNNLMLNIDYTQRTTEAQHDFDNILFLATYALMLIFLHSRVISYCEDVNSESRNTLNTCYNLQQTVSPTSEERNELIILSDMVNLLKPRTNAAGFYYINRSLLSRVFAYVFSYLIVLIQFNKIH